MIALLRAVNVGRRRLPMAELRALAGDLGFRDPRTYVASGNLVFAADDQAPEAAALALEAAIAARYGWTSEVILRTADQWAAYAAGSPFPDAEAARAKQLHLLLSQRPPVPEAAARLIERAAPGDRIAARGDAIWIDFASVADSRLTPAFIERCMGSPATARNWNTVVQLQAMAQQ